MTQQASAKMASSPKAGVNSPPKQLAKSPKSHMISPRREINLTRQTPEASQISDAGKKSPATNAIREVQNTVSKNNLRMRLSLD